MPAQRPAGPAPCVAATAESLPFENYLDETVRRGTSVWATIGREVEQRAVRSLRRDLATGWWAERNRDVLDLEAAELGLRLLIA
jgi:hypothetical protein